LAPLAGDIFLFKARKTLLESLPLLGALARRRLLEVLELGAGLRQLLASRHEPRRHDQSAAAEGRHSQSGRP
jgi:hypothetical protein